MEKEWSSILRRIAMIGKADFYKACAEAYIIAYCGLDRIDQRLLDMGYQPVPADKMISYQKNDYSGLHFYYLMNDIHYDRLSQSERDGIESVRESLLQMDEDSAPDSGIEQKIINAIRMAGETMKRVLPHDPDSPEREYLIYDSVDESGRARAGDIIFGFSIYPRFDAEGMFADLEEEEDRAQKMISIAGRTQEYLGTKLACPVRVIVNNY